jgi:hypothetical protein
MTKTREVKVHLITYNDEIKIPVCIDEFDEIQTQWQIPVSYLSMNLKTFTIGKYLPYRWEIILRRGLDIFEKRSGYTIEDSCRKSAL